MIENIFTRSELLLGSAVMKRIAEVKVLIFGVGGVGSWCAASLVRSGVRHLTIVDSDCVSVSNVNRQLMATSRTVGKVKVEVLKAHLLEINPDVDVVALQAVYNAENADSFHLEDYDYVVDAIDSLENKAHLILHATRLCKETGHPVFFSSMGAALRLDTLSVRSAEFWDIQGDALARALRNKFKKNKVYPARKFKCVYSIETPLPNQVIEEQANTSIEVQTPVVVDTWAASKAQVNGSVVQVTATFGLALSSLIIQDVRSKVS